MDCTKRRETGILLSFDFDYAACYFAYPSISDAMTLAEVHLYYECTKVEKVVQSSLPREISLANVPSPVRGLLLDDVQCRLVRVLHLVRV